MTVENIDHLNAMAYLQALKSVMDSGDPEARRKAATQMRDLIGMIIEAGDHRSQRKTDGKHAQSGPAQSGSAW